jgi:hypothetical protein
MTVGLVEILQRARFGRPNNVDCLTILCMTGVLKLDDIKSELEEKDST